MARQFIYGGNLWGRNKGLEAQRADLWVVDMKRAVDLVRAITRLESIPKDDNVNFAARQITFPEEGVDTKEFRRGTGVPYMMPDMDMPTGTTNMTFLHESTSGDGSLMSFFNAWKSLVRLGRGGSGDDALPCDIISFDNMQASEFKASGLRRETGQWDYWDYRADVVVRLLRGVDVENLVKNLGAGNVSAYQEWEVGGEYILRDAWPSRVQLGELSYDSGNALLNIRVQFQCAKVVDITRSNTRANITTIATGASVSNIA
jgi:hypothetical protein